MAKLGQYVAWGRIASGTLAIVVLAVIVILLGTTERSSSIVMVPWMSPDWSNRVKIVVDHTKVAENVSNFPVYIDLSSMESSFFNAVQAQGNDIRVTSGDGVTEVASEVVAINTTNRTGELHFKAPSLSATVSSEFYIYYNNPSAAAYPRTHALGSQNVWTNGYVGAWHFGTNSNVIEDSTANLNNGTPYGVSHVSGTVMGSGYSFDGVNDYINIGNTPSLNLTGPMTICTWSNVDVASAFNELFSKGDVQYVLKVNGVGRYEFKAGDQFFLSDVTVPTSTWRHVCGRYNGSTTSMLVDASLQSGGMSVGSVTATSAPVYMGSNAQHPSRFMKGTLSEVRVSNVFRSNGWVATEFANQSSPNTFYNSVLPETYSAASEWYDTDWPYRKKITIPAQSIGATLTNFPVYVNLANLGGDFFNAVDASGLDIRITTANGVTELSQDLVTFSKSGNYGELHFKAPVLSNTSSNEFYIYYGKANPTRVSDAQSVWSNGYAGVWHMQRQGGSTSLDSTANQNHGVMSGPTTFTNDFLGDTFGFDGVNDFINYNNPSSLNLTGPMTLCSWVRPNQRLIFNEILTKGDFQYALKGNSNGKYEFKVNNQWIFSDADVSTTAWSHVCGRYDGTTISLLVNAFQQSATKTTSNVGATNEPVWMGRNSQQQSRYMNARLSEVRVSNVARTNHWILAEYANQNNPQGFYVLGMQQLQPNTGSLSVNIVDGSGNSVDFSSAQLSSVSTAFGCEKSTGTLGTTNQRLRVQNTSNTPSWSMSLAATNGPDALWQSETALYDYNDTAGSPAGCSPGLDNDAYAGSLGILTNNATVTPKSGCSANGVSLGLAGKFQQGVADAITVMSANSDAATNCYWDITGLGVEQQIPAEQHAGSYSLSLTLTVVAN